MRITQSDAKTDLVLADDNLLDEVALAKTQAILLHTSHGQDAQPAHNNRTGWSKVEAISAPNTAARRSTPSKSAARCTKRSAQKQEDQFSHKPCSMAMTPASENSCS